jgi:hypothetical protein
MMTIVFLKGNKNIVYFEPNMSDYGPGTNTDLSYPKSHIPDVTILID